MKSIMPVSYRIRIEPNLTDFRFVGSMELKVTADRPVDTITLDILELAVYGCYVHSGSGFKDCRYSVDPEKEELCVFLPEMMSSEITLKIEYTGFINDKMAGFYRSRYEKNGKTEYLAVTQFEESDARRAFPCFDHPVYKATFDIEMLVDENLAAVSNSPVEEERSSGGGKKLVKFGRTPKMSTYLIFFGAGEFEFLEETGKTLVRVLSVPGTSEYGKYGLAFGRKENSVRRREDGCAQCRLLAPPGGGPWRLLP